MSDERCQFCNQAILVLYGGSAQPIPVNMPGQVRWVEREVPGRLGISAISREIHYQEHVETCTAAKLLRKKLDEAEAQRQKEVRVREATAAEAADGEA